MNFYWETWIAAVVLLFVIVMTIGFGMHIQENTIEHQCNSFQAFTLDSGKYTCQKVEAK